MRSSLLSAKMILLFVAELDRILQRMQVKAKQWQLDFAFVLCMPFTRIGIRDFFFFVHGIRDIVPKSYCP